MSAGLIFVAIFGSIVSIPCIAIAVLGYKTIMQLGTYPSKTPAIQMSVFFKLLVTEVVSFTLILAFFKALVAG